MQKKSARFQEKNIILINVFSHQVRIAHIQNKALSDFYLENLSSPSLVGSVYKAKVVKSLLGFGSFFVDLGHKKRAFLHVKNPKSKREKEGTTEGEKTAEKEGTTKEERTVKGEKTVEKVEAVRKFFKIGQSILVQVVKDSLGSKNIRVTSEISLPGRHIVYVPESDFQIALSHKIRDEKQRKRLTKIMSQWNEKEGVIVRTLGEKASEETLKKDLDHLKQNWKNIKKKFHTKKKEGLLWSEVYFPAQILRDILTEEVDQVLIDDKEMYENLLNFSEQNLPNLKNKICFYEGKTPLFDLYDLEPRLSGLLDKKISLPSGGFLVIEKTEAGVVVDVNTGKFAGKKTLEENILHINLEAAKEIILQLRLRNYGGIILIDFIDMETEESKKKLMDLLDEELSKDREPTRLFAISELGVVSISRKRTRPSLLESLCEPCSHCGGSAYFKRSDTVAYEIFRELKRMKNSHKKTSLFSLFCHPDIANWIHRESKDSSLLIRVNPSFHKGYFELSPHSSKK